MYHQVAALRLIVGGILFLLSVTQDSLADRRESFVGEVVGISDGDTIKVLRQGREEKVRLQGVDCPESSQAFGTQAKKFTSDLTFKKKVNVQSRGRDRYGRVLGEVTLPDERTLNQELVKSGMCWWYSHYEPTNKTLEELQSRARAEKKGLWKDSHPVPPWEFRQSAREGGSGRAQGKIVQKDEAVQQQIPVIGNKRSHLYHKSTCPGYALISPNNKIYFGSEEEAKKAGYSIAGGCR